VGVGVGLAVGGGVGAGVGVGGGVGVGVGLAVGGGVGVGVGPAMGVDAEVGGGVRVAVGTGACVAGTELVVAIVGALVAVGDGVTRTTVGLATGMDAAAGFGVWVVDARLGVGDAPAVSANETAENAESDAGVGVVGAASPAAGTGTTSAHKVMASTTLASHTSRST
jgi:hypothetical protein